MKMVENRHAILHLFRWLNCKVKQKIRVIDIILKTFLGVALFTILVLTKLQNN